MRMTEYRKALPREEGRILDFIDLVFSQAYEPHDFEKLLPKVYAHAGFSRYHFVAEEDGRIVSTVALLPIQLRVDAEDVLKCGYIGSVSVHRNARGAGHMRALMRLALEDARAQGMDFLALGGQRQRYGYYGFECGGEKLIFTVTRANLRHAQIRDEGLTLREITDAGDPSLGTLHAAVSAQPMTCVRDYGRFLDIMHSWNGRYYALEKEGKTVGGLYARGGRIDEMTLLRESLAEQAVAAWLRNDESCKVRVPACNRVRASFLKRFAENYTVADAEMLRVFNWRRVIESCLTFKGAYQPLCDGEFVFEVAGEARCRISVQDHAVAVTECQDRPEAVFTPQKAVEFFFSPFTALSVAPAMLRSWLPLPLEIPAADAF